MPLPPYYLEVILVSGMACLVAVVMNSRGGLQVLFVSFTKRFNQQYEKSTSNFTTRAIAHLPPREGSNSPLAIAHLPPGEGSNSPPAGSQAGALLPSREGSSSSQAIAHLPSGEGSNSPPAIAHLPPGEGSNSPPAIAHLPLGKGSSSPQAGQSSNQARSVRQGLRQSNRYRAPQASQANSTISWEDNLTTTPQ